MIPSYPELRRFPLSFSQQRLWFLYQLDPHDPTYYMQSAIRLRGPLEVERLGRCFACLVDRHEVLRTRFDADHAEPFQEVLPPPSAPMTVVDLTQHPADERDTILRVRAAELAREPFRLEDGHLCRIVLFSLRHDEHILVVTLHHIIADHWTWGILTRELEELYGADCVGKPATMPPLTHRFGDYVLWQRARCEQPEVQQSLAYWKDRLKGAPSWAELPTDWPRPPVRTYHGDCVSLTLPADLVDSFRRFCRKRSATAFMGLLAVYQVLLSRYSHERDVVVGTPVAGRLAWEFESIAGMFVNNVVLRNNLSDNPSFEDCLRSVKSSVLAALEHQEAPFEKVLDEVHPARSMAHSPLIQTMFILQTSASGSPSLPGVTWEPLSLGPRTAKFDWTLEVWPVGKELQLDLEYNTDLFDRDTAKRLLRCYRTLVRAVVEQPTGRVLGLDMLDDSERQAVEQWNRTSAQVPDLCLHELFEQQARTGPERIALQFQNEQISYGDLERRAEALAHRLRASGTEPDRPVAVCLPRSVDLVVALLGVLKAGGAYVPIDPLLPPDRIRYMLEDLGEARLITTPSLAADLGVSEPRLLFADASTGTNAAGSASAAHVGPKNLAYVIYTSGSTGRPKGVAIEHYGVVNLLLSMQDLLEFRRDDVMLSGTTVSFDIFVLELFLPLCVGAKVVLATHDEVRDGFALAETIEASGATWLQATPTGWRILLASGWAGSPRLRALCGGEPLTPDLAAELRKRVGTLWHAYGPTETTVWSTAEKAEAPSDLTIGRPLWNTRIYVVDELGAQVPIGVFGEICIGGAGVARGYVGRPELTAAQFVPDLFSPEPNARMYRTGDRGRYRSDGRLECSGRFDYQVKIRGHRIEPGEIENRLVGHDGIRQCVVTVRQDATERPGERALVAYYVPRTRALSTEALRKHLRAFLPEHMLPDRFVALPELPRTPNGKVDRKALPAPPHETGASTRSGDGAPATDLERDIAAVWAEVLGRPPARTDDFFALGGHSLLAMQVVARLRERIERKVQVRTLLAHPVLHDLAAELETEAEGERLPALRPRPRAATIPASYQQLPLWLLARLHPEAAMYNICCAYRILGPCSASTLSLAVQAVVARHESLRTTFATESGPVQVIHDHVSVPLPVADLEGTPPDARQEAALSLVRLQATVPFDIAKGPLVRAQLLRLAQREHILALTIHHLVCDGWSLGVLTRDLIESYRCIERHGGPDLGGAGLQYADFTLWQRECYPESLLAEFLAFWKEELAGANTVLQLPFDAGRPPIPRNQGARRFFQWSAELTVRIKSLAREHDATVFAVLMAGFLVLLHEQTGARDILVGAPVARRDQPGLQNLVGCLVDTIVLRGDLSGDPDFVTVMARVRERLHRALDRGVLPLDRIVDGLGIERDLSRSPLFQVMFEMHDGEPPPAADLVSNGSTQFLPLALDIKTSQYDLLLSVQDQGETFSGNVQYDTDLFHEARVIGWVERLEAILVTATSDPTRAISKWLMHDDDHRDRGERTAPTESAKAPPAAAPSPPELPIARREEEVSEGHREVAAYRMDGAPWRQLVREARRHDLPREAVYLAAYAHVIAYWSTSPAFSIGIDEAGKRHRSIPFDFSTAAAFADYASALAKELVPPSPTPEPCNDPRLPVVFRGGLQHAPSRCGDSVDSNVRRAPWLEHWAVEDDDGVEFGWSYRPELFPAQLPTDLISAHQALLERLSHGPATWTWTMPIELPPRQCALQNRVNDTAGPIPRDLLHSGFVRHARSHPDRLAVIAPDRELRYGELDRFTNQVARRVRQLGAARNRLVAVLVDRGWEQIAAIVGILKSGAGYVPIDPTWPAERIGNILGQAKVDIVLTQRRFLTSRTWPEPMSVLAVDDATIWEGASEADLEIAQAGDDIAYVLFTSGSTGVPKGVVLNHTSPVNTIHHFHQQFALSADDRALALSAITFDLSVYDIFGMLTAGGAIVVPTADGTRDPEEWLALMNRHRVTLWNSVPMFMQMLTEYLSAGRAAPQGLRLVLLSGDWIPVPLPERIRSFFPETEVWASGGPTETFYSILYKIDTVDPSWNSIPYGKPLTNQRIYVLNDWMQPCPEWVPGHMYVGGISLARGYLQNKEQTALRFIRHPRSGEPLYWTGDLGRFLPDGNVEFLGREDHQVKILGHRIELGEIETVLLELPALEAAVVTAEAKDSGAPRLVCYYVLQAGHTADFDAWELHLRARLPEYMVPAAWAALERLPLTPNGKVDRRALAKLEIPKDVRPRATESVGPRNELERQIAALWTKVLRVNEVGVHDDFFALGGNSLSSILMVDRARELGIDVTPRDVFLHRTIAGLVAAMGARSPVNPLPHDGAGEQPLTTLQRWFFSALEGRHRPERWNVNVLMDLDAPLNAAAFERAVLAVANHHEGLRARFERTGGTCRQIIDAPWQEAPFQVIDLSALPDASRVAELERRCDDLQDRFDFGAGKLWRFVFFPLDQTGRGRLWMNAHHLVVDGMSLGILLEDLRKAYEGFCRGEATRLPPKGTSLGKWAQALEDWTRKDLVPNERDYWLHLPWHEIAPLPADVGRDGHRCTVDSIRDHVTELEDRESGFILYELPKRHGVNPEDALMAALIQSLANWTGHDWQDVMALHAGRDRLMPDRPDLDVSRTVGWLSAERVLVLRRSHETDALRAVFDIRSQLAQIPHGGHGYNLLRFMGGDPGLSDALAALRKRPGVLFNFQGPRSLDVPGYGSYAPENPGYDEPPQNLRFNLFECHALVVGEHLQIRWRFSANVHDADTVVKVAHDFNAFLHRVAVESESQSNRKADA